MVGTDETQGTCYGIYYAASGLISALVNAICLWASKFGADETHAFVIAMWVMAVGTILAFFNAFAIFLKKKMLQVRTRTMYFR